MIDDDPDMVDIGRIIIKRAGFEFIPAATGGEGLAKMIAEEPDLIILDYMMPEMNGLEFFNELKQNPEYSPYKDTPVIVLTAREDEHIDQTPLFESGLAAFLIKPFGHRELINVIENVLMMTEIRRKNAELKEEVKRTKYRYRDLIENANDLIFMLDNNGKINFVNRKLNDITGFEQQEWLDHFLEDIVIPQDKQIVEEAISDAKRGNPSQVQIRIRDRQNMIRYFSANINPLTENKKLSGMVGVARDVTEKYNLESKIANLESFTQSIVTSMGSGLITVDQERRITFFNAAAEEILGFRAEEVLYRSIDDIFANGESTTMLPKETQNHDPVFGQEMEISNASGNKVHIGFSHTPWLDRADHFLGTIITFRDISESKRMQIEMVRMDRLASLGILAAGLAHEIRNPLAGIKTMAQALEEEVADDDPQLEYLHRIVRQVNRLDELLKAFFSYARPRPPIKKLHQLPDIVHEVSVLLAKRLKSKKVVFKESYSKNLKPVLVDLNQIQQVFLNLIINALDALPNGGELTISAKNIKAHAVRMERRGRSYRKPQEKLPFVEVKIADTGIGIKPEHFESIFDPFFTTKPKGIGLGLSIVYRIIEEHGGEITINSELGKGSIFTILLPTEG